MAHTLVRYLLLCGLAVLALAFWKQESLPDPASLQAEVLHEPDQVPVKRSAFNATVKGVTYAIQPLYRYELNGLVVSRHDTSGWWNYIHREWQDHINVADLCVVWGDNVSSGAYRQVDFSSGQFVCYYSWSSHEAGKAFNPTEISNNHLLVTDARMARKIRSARIGDQVRFSGYLAEYSHNHGGMPFKRGTSTTRTDTGNGACETVYVETFDIVKSGGGPWRALFWVGVLALGVGLAGWLMLPVRFED